MSSGSSRTEFWTKIGGIATVLSVIVAIVIAVVQSSSDGKQSERRPETFTPAPPTTSASSATIIAGTSKPAPAEPPTSIFTPIAAGSIYHQGRLQMVPGGGFDLDAPPDDPKWRNVLLVEIYPYPNHRIVVDSTARSLFLGKTAATYELCSSTTLMVSAVSLDSGQVQPGNSFCMKTSGKRYAGIQVVAVNGDLVTIDITVWDPPDPD